jgi:hypothetical protein
LGIILERVAVDVATHDLRAIAQLEDVIQISLGRREFETGMAGFEEYEDIVETEVSYAPLLDLLI